MDGNILDSDERYLLHQGDCLAWLATLPAESAQLVITSPPYNIGKPYEKRLAIDEYVNQQARVITE